ncbi:acyltransferase domain-containing protein [Streptomyces gardneri]|nr:acyltransferase domain-containing protein [Streptomyces gardneri]
MLVRNKTCCAPTVFATLYGEQPRRSTGELGMLQTNDRTVFLFPGLGAYSPAALRSAALDHPWVADELDKIDYAAADYGIPAVRPVLLGEQELSIEDMLTRPAAHLQLAIFATSIATHKILMDSGARPRALVGHSFGEIAALVSSGAFTLADGVYLVWARARALEPWEGRGAMAAISVDVETAAHIIGALEAPELVVACVNAPRQTVLSGPVEAIDAAEPVVQALGAFFTKLYLPYASHHPSMHPAATAFVQLTSGIAQHHLEIPVISPIHGRRYTDDDDLTTLLGQCLVLPVRFTDTIRNLHEHGVSRYVEVGALRALTRCAELTVPDIQTYAPLSDPGQAVAELAAAARGNGAVTPQHRPAMSAVLVTEAAPVPEPVAPPPTSAATLPQEPAPQRAARDDVTRRLRALYADLLEYPPDVLTEDAMLEADLGVDSLKQTALLTKVIEMFELTRPPNGVTVLDYPSLGHIAEWVLQQRQAGR